MIGGKASHSVIRLTPPPLSCDRVIRKQKKKKKSKAVRLFIKCKMPRMRANGKSDKLYNFKLFNILAVKALFHVFIHLSIHVFFLGGGRLWPYFSALLFGSLFLFVCSFECIDCQNVCMFVAAALHAPYVSLHLCSVFMNQRYEPNGKSEFKNRYNSNWSACILLEINCHSTQLLITTITNKI